MTKNKKKIVNVKDKYADFVINSLSWGHFHEQPFVSWFSIGLPIMRDFFPNKVTNKVDQSNKCTRILHAPSQPEAKGTKKIKEAIESLKSSGYPIEFVEISEQPQFVVFKELDRCDFVVDQLYADFLMAGFAAEAASFGKPAVVGSYYTNYVKYDVPENEIPPSYYCHPDKIEEAIEKMIVDKNFRIDLGKKAKAFVETNWNPKMVAQRYLQLITGNYPKEWLCDPKKIHYLYGCCISEVRAKELICGIIEQEGKEALQLSDKPKLEKRFVEFAYTKK